MTEEHKRVAAALIGLVGAIGNHGKTERTDDVVRMALLGGDAEQAVELIHQEKYRISPGCATCASPCGNTADYDIAKFEQAAPEIRGLKEELFQQIMITVQNSRAGELPDCVYRGLAYLGYDLAAQSYRDAIQALKKE